VPGVDGKGEKRCVIGSLAGSSGQVQGYAQPAAGGKPLGAQATAAWQGVIRDSGTKGADISSSGESLYRKLVQCQSTPASGVVVAHRTGEESNATPRMLLPASPFSIHGGDPRTQSCPFGIARALREV
jgi:hypothetical protein